MTRALLLLLVTGCEIGPAIYIDRAGDGDGEVTSEPEGLHCGDDCAMIVDDGTITLTATPRSGSRFAGWGVDGCEGTAPCTLQLGRDTHVAARFEPVMHTVTVEHTGEGTGLVTSYADLGCRDRCEMTYREGSTIMLAAIPDPGSELVGWRGACAGNDPVCYLTVVEPLAVVAEFRLLPVLSVVKVGEGRIVSEPVAGIDCGTQCSFAFPRNTDVVLRPLPAAGWAFAGWEGPCAVLPMGCRVTTTGEAQTVKATFAEGCDAVVLFDSDASLFNQYLATPNRTICLANGVTITGPVVFGANDITVRRATPTATVRFSNPSGPAIELAGKTGIRLDGLDITGGAMGSYGIRITGGSLQVANSTIASGSVNASAGIYSTGGATLDVANTSIAGLGDSILVQQSSVVVRDSSLVCTHAFGTPIVILGAGATLELRDSTLRTMSRAVYGGPSTLRLDGNTLSRIAGSTTSASPLDSETDSVWHSSVANTFCNEGTSSTDGEFVLPLIRGTYSSASTFDGVAHIFQGDCP